MFTVPKTERKLPPAGTHVARLVSVVDLGTQPGGQYDPARKIRLAFELCNELDKFGDDEEERPYLVSQTYTLSLGEKANLRKHLESWRGKPFTDEELRGFDETKIIGKPCMVTIVHVEKGEKTYANLTTVTGLPKGMTAPEQVNASVIYHVTGGKNNIYASLPTWLQETIAKSPEFQGVTAKGNSKDRTVNDAGDDISPQDRSEPEGGDDIPF